MKISLIQSDIRWGDPAENRKRFERRIAEAGEADLFVLPEMFTTGFCTVPRSVAEPDGSVTLEWMQRTAQREGAAMAGSVAVEQGGRYYNRFYFVRPDGTFHAYDKRHLFTYGGEHLEYTAGTERIVVEYEGWRILPLVCYDLRFPVWSRNRDDYDLMLYVASWPASRVDAWSALLRARAIENLSYVAGVNRVGDDPNCSYCGGSALIDFKGHTMADGGTDNREALLCGELSLGELRAFREKFPALHDADAFTLNM